MADEKKGKIVWDQIGKRLYETGVDHGILYPEIDPNGGFTGGVAWNGLTEVTESPTGAEATAIYADNIKYLNLVSIEEFGGTIGAYTYPPEFEACDGSASPVPGVTIGQQTRKMFGLCYRTKIGNDVDGDDHGYKLHCVYNALVTPSDRNYNTVNDSPEAINFNWEFSTTSVNVTGYKPTATLVIDSTLTDPDKLATLEDILCGTEDTVPRLPMPDEIITLLTSAEG